MLTTDVAVVGAGPAGLYAAIEAAKAGAKTTIINEYVEPGGQLTKQIHKFFGSKEHAAGVRGIDISAKLLGSIDELKVEKRMGTLVWSIFHSNILAIAHNGKSEMLRANKIILATGASENAFAFPGWTLPGVMGAGAAQTLINLQRILPGNRVLMVGAGNVGLIVAFQLLQAGSEVVAVVDALPYISGYCVHSAKIARAGIPILTSHTVKKAYGEISVEGVMVVKVDNQCKPIPKSEQDMKVDTICIAVGLTPLVELAWLANCRFTWVASLGGYVPLYDDKMETTVKGIYVAGDAAGIEEASTAMEEGSIAAISAVESLGLMTQQRAYALRAEAYERLRSFRIGPFGKLRDQGKQFIWRERQKYAERI
ncbi:MAG: FAD-dependent oxidoreductase [Spirochaetota bacterium]|nr:MAG: FAD-dependent oxidoreductase [Spirochaetota bacterium]